MSLDLFTEVKATERPTRATKVPNPFFDAVKVLAENRDKTFNFELKNLVVEGDENETMDKVATRARQYLTVASDKYNETVDKGKQVSIEMRRNDKTNVITFWATEKRTMKPRTESTVKTS